MEVRIAGREEAGDMGSIRRYDERNDERSISGEWCCSVIGTIRSVGGRECEKLW